MRRSTFIFASVLFLSCSSRQDNIEITHQQGSTTMIFPHRASEEELRSRLTEEQYRVTQQKGTERPFSGEYDTVTAAGTYRCIVCGAPLFRSESKFDAGCGWPSFSAGIDSTAILETMDASHGMRRIEVVCSRCGAHLGHVFPDGPQPTGLRYCINSVSLHLLKDADSSAASE
jgi:peptide-methionine (R)-S-oxide reductase